MICKKGGMMLDIFIDALIDSFKVFIICLIFFILVELITNNIKFKFDKNSKLSPIVGASFGIIPQCGSSVFLSEKFIARKITIGTLIACFIACSDESIPILLSSSERLMVIPLILVKFIFGFTVGYTVDFFYKGGDEALEFDVDSCNCHNNLERYLVHPLVHSLKILGFVFVINMIFGGIIYLVGEDSFKDFLNTNRALTPLFSVIIGIIPNCSSSVIITQMFISNAIPFAALVAGLSMNAGLGIIYILKSKNTRKDATIIFVILILSSLLIGYGIYFGSYVF